MSVEAHPLPALEPLVRSSTKRTRAVFASAVGMPVEDEKRHVHPMVFFLFSNRRVVRECA